VQTFSDGISLTGLIKLQEHRTASGDDMHSSQDHPFPSQAETRLHPSIAPKVMLASTVLVILSFASLGSWVAGRIEESVKLDVGHRASLYMEAVLAPELQGLDTAPTLSPAAITALSTAVGQDARRLDVLETRVWSLDGRVLFADPPDMMGRQFEVTDDFLQAREGSVTVDFDHHPHVALDGGIVPPVPGDRFEIYAPIYSASTGEVLAVAEFYQNGEMVIAAVDAARLETWIATSLAGAALIAGIGAVVLLGTRLIERQRAALDRQVDELVLLLGQNEDLRTRIAKATQRGTEVHEAVLRRIGSDLHDGVGQLITIVLLRLQKLFGETEGQSAEYATIRSLLQDCMTEVRHMAAGLALPEVKSLSLDAAIHSVVSRHEYRTGTSVDLVLTPVCVEPGHPVRLGICRMIQEGLNNAFKHADGVGQTVDVDCSPTRIAVEVRDRGPGIRARSSSEKRETLGLVGLRNRLESLGAALTVRSDSTSGTTLRAEFPLQLERLDHE
jgi:signal transduction histidine kinase